MTVVLGAIAILVATQVIYSMELVSNEVLVLDVSLGTLIAMVLCGFPIILVSRTTMNYGLVCAVPVKASVVPVMLSLCVDFVHFANLITELVIIAVKESYNLIPMKIISVLIMYICAHVMLNINVTPGLLQREVRYRKNTATAAIFFFEIIIIIAAVSFTIIASSAVKYTVPIRILVGIAIAVLSVAAVIARTVSYKLMKNKIRLIRVYKEIKEKEEKEISYI